MTSLVRTPSTGMVHTRGCRYAKNGVPWKWASGKTHTEVALGTLFTDLRFCIICTPLVFDGIYE